MKRPSNEDFIIKFLKSLNETESAVQVLELMEKMEPQNCLSPEKCNCHDCDIHPSFSPAIIYEKEK